MKEPRKEAIGTRLSQQCAGRVSFCLHFPVGENDEEE